MAGLLRPRWLIAAGVVLGMLVLGAIAFIALEPPGSTSSDARPACSPRPCTAPGGFEVDIGNLSLRGGRLIVDVAFKNNTAAGGFESVTYRHTSPADFSLHYGGDDHRPLVDATCPKWEEARVERGASTASGPDRLCFAAPPGGAAGAELRWSPDEGIFPIAGSIALDGVPLGSPSPTP